MEFPMQSSPSSRAFCCADSPRYPPVPKVYNVWYYHSTSVRSGFGPDLSLGKDRKLTVNLPAVGKFQSFVMLAPVPNGTFGWAFSWSRTFGMQLISDMTMRICSEVSIAENPFLAAVLVIECFFQIMNVATLSNLNNILSIIKRKCKKLKCLKNFDFYGLGRPKNKTYPSASTISKPLKLSLLSCMDLLNVTSLDLYSSNNLSGSAVKIYASHGAHSWRP